MVFLRVLPTDYLLTLSHVLQARGPDMCLSLDRCALGDQDLTDVIGDVCGACKATEAEHTQEGKQGWLCPLRREHMPLSLSSLRPRAHAHDQGGPPR